MCNILLLYVIVASEVMGLAVTASVPSGLQLSLPWPHCSASSLPRVAAQLRAPFLNLVDASSLSPLNSWVLDIGCSVAGSLGSVARYQRSQAA